ncbi:MULTISPECIES: DUF2971 domain-containing protein [unclassified Pseudoalteromonas]|uniref:DUF2971 domain-containing protein n=1 Tax=unclassified Pseudoalteromonas TaxID=194690 RepID=UPI00258AE23A|nr:MULTISPECIES: DUF2971 domain-containing protein [unclassified Pseudoalteromonas]MDN3431460.1 DUF2971 domain-containing protein [Pseudoalteromonas sp. APC 3907]MDN3433829.1 DUF2971 domain-containing protein [Pseudoalteromonas sp. APC 3356]MDN3463822.1 DUF2971 domain-containing protein [Pseudoalteromonas sp. APC 3495]
MENTLFRYYSPSSEHYLSTFTKKELYFSHPSDFNDPFDCQIEYERALEDALTENELNDHYSLESLKNKLDDALKKIGVCCFCRAKKNQLMWSHYAASHKGICIGFNKRELLKGLAVAGIENVIYQSKHPLDNISGQLALAPHDNPPSLKTLLNIFIYPLLKTKYSYWKYERETRLIAHNFGVQPITNKAVQSVTFGLKTSEEDKLQILSELMKVQWEHVMVFQARKAEGRFAIEFDRLSKNGELICQ